MLIDKLSMIIDILREKAFLKCCCTFQEKTAAALNVFLKKCLSYV